jgi:hypothetical protein
MNEDFRNLFGGDMDDEEFRRLFTRIMNQRQRQMEHFLRIFYGLGNGPMDFPLSPSSRDNGISGRTPSEPNNENDVFDMFKNMFGNGVDFGNSEIDEDGWETRNWTSPDGSMSFSSSSRVFNMDPDEAERVFGGGPEKKEDSIEILTQKMNKAILEERYEDAAQFRDDIKVLKGEPKMDNLNKFKKAMREDNEENSDNSEK